MLSKPRILLALIAVALTVTVAARFAHADASTFNLGYFNKLAMNGYDVMTYWHGGEPLEGDHDITFTYEGATWVFVSEENRDLFASAPATYAPQYGGYCAYAASLGELSDVDPFAWRIYENKLYMNYDPQVRRLWANDIDENIAKADTLWPAPLGTSE